MASEDFRSLDGEEAMGRGECFARRAAAAAFFGYLPAKRGVRGLLGLNRAAGQIPGVHVSRVNKQHAAYPVTEQRPCRRTPARPATPRTDRQEEPLSVQKSSA